jgi:hypothetical protein
MEKKAAIQQKSNIGEKQKGPIRSETGYFPTISQIPSV